MSKYRLGHGKVISAICKKCGRYYYCDENYQRGTCDVCNSWMMGGKRSEEANTGQNLRHKGKHEETY